MGVVRSNCHVDSRKGLDPWQGHNPVEPGNVTTKHPGASYERRLKVLATRTALRITSNGTLPSVGVSAVL